MEERRSDRQCLGSSITKVDGPLISGDQSDDNFEFSFRSREPLTGGAAADEVFSDGRISVFYPVFGRVYEDARAPSGPEQRLLGRLFSEQAWSSSVGSTSSSSSLAATDSTDLDSASLDSFCIWTPGVSPASSPRPPRKSGSMGYLSWWRRVSKLVLGRSRIDGRDKFLFLSAPPSPAREQPKGKPTGRKGKAATEVPTVAASHGMFYSAKASPSAAWRTFLPYRQDLMGLFSASKGLSRSQYQSSY